MKQSIVEHFLACPACKSPSLNPIAFQSEGDNLINAVIACNSCETWYRLEDGVLELLIPSLRDKPRDLAFRARFNARWDGWEKGARDASPQHDVTHKLEQKEFYDEDAIQYENEMLRLPFWNAFDRTYIEKISSIAGYRNTMLEIGCGTGRISLPMRADCKVALCFDLSEAMVRTAIRKRALLGESAEHVHYFVADAENIPVQSACADIAIFSGILHHVEHPDFVIREMTRALAAGGCFLGNENNRSAFRPIFDLLMRVKKLWNEKAHEEHFIISQRELKLWFSEAGISGSVWTSVFLPPHLFNLLSVDSAERWLRFSDLIGRSIPWFKMQGGLVLFSGEKRN
jgi:ubiquinone/menaquinone biosynthesis C-methylase UbiE/uncharacterized protein YbaR (Trm112 family)